MQRRATAGAIAAALQRPGFRAAAKRIRTLGELAAFACREFERAGLSFGHGTDNALDDAVYLIRHALKLPKRETTLAAGAPLTALQLHAALSVLEQRVLRRCPSAYLTREAWLGKHAFYVDERAIVPRSFLAEWLRADLALWFADRHQVRRALELCTGAGALAVLLAKTFPGAQVDATDISPQALAVARRNLARYRLSNRIRLLQADLFDDLPRLRYDLIVANPPYVTSAALRRLPSEFRAEPQLALAGGRDGLDLVRRILRQAGSFLSRDGLLVMEVGHARRRIERAYPKVPFMWIETSAGDDVVLALRADELRDAVA
jgi:ribosomal protein L3 glutamine methyltransferase